jgi:ketosteroid isomerase-like protein
MSEENIEIVRRMFEDWNRRAFDSALEAVSPEVEVEMSAQSDIDGTYLGHDGLRRMLRFWGAFADFRSTIHHRGRGKTSGVDVEMTNWQVFTLREGRIVRYRVFGSRDEALEAAGLRE